MRGREENQDHLYFSINVESRIRADHPLRSRKQRVDSSLLRWMSFVRRLKANLDDPACHRNVAQCVAIDGDLFDSK